MSPTRTALEKGKRWPLSIGFPKCSIGARVCAVAVVVITRTPVAIALRRFIRDSPSYPFPSGEREGRGSLVHHLIVGDAPQIGRADIAVALAELDPAPAVVTFADAPDRALLGEVADSRRVGRVHANLARVARFDDRGAAVAEQRHQHPATGAVRVLDQAP